MGFATSLDTFFRISERGSDIRTEVKGGILIFLTMSYIIVVNNRMMIDAGMDPGASFTSTILMSIIGTLAMGLYAKFPVAMAPGMGMNAMFCYTAVISMGFTWQESLVAVIISGLAFVIVSLSGARQRILVKIPRGVRTGMTAGIGCFIAFIGLHNSGLITSDPSTLVALGDMSNPSILLALFCILITVFLVSRKVSAGVLIGMIVTAIVGMVFGIIAVPESVFSAPAMPPVGEFIDGIGPNLFTIEFLMVVISLAFMEFFDGSGTLMAVGGRANLVDDNGNVTCGRALNVDACVASLSGVVGCTPTTAFVESAVGIEAGARSGLAAVIVAILFAMALFIAPLFSVVDYSCTVGAMIIVAATMVADMKGAELDDLPTAMTIISTILMMILTYSITTGIAFGIVMYCVSMLGARRGREVSSTLYGLAVIMVLYLIAYAISF